jgi:hypothetical protein
MAAPKRFKLTQAVIDSWYTESGQFSFRTGYDKDNGKTICGPMNCPPITIQDTDIVQTTNKTAQDYLLKFQIPQGVTRNGVKPPAGQVWLDVTATQPVANVDLDPYFP